MRGVLGTMTDELANEVARISVRLLDEAYMVWLAAEGECEEALRGWSVETSRVGAEAYCKYRAALDREEAAARDLQKLHEVAQLYPGASHRRRTRRRSTTSDDQRAFSKDVEPRTNSRTVGQAR